MVFEEEEGGEVKDWGGEVGIPTASMPERRRLDLLDEGSWVGGIESPVGGAPTANLDGKVGKSDVGDTEKVENRELSWAKAVSKKREGLVAVGANGAGRTI